MDCPILRIGLSRFSPLDHYRLGQCIAQAVETLGRRAVFIASGDLSHKLRDDGPYGFAPEGPEFDRQITEAMAEGDFLHFLTMDPALCDRAAEQCHVEVTTLLIPGENDSEEEIRSLTHWLASVELCTDWPMWQEGACPLSIQGIADAEMFGACLLFAGCKAAQTQKFPRDKGCARSPFEVSVKNTQRGLCNLSVHM